MTNCEFLTYERSPSCGNCTGWRCIAKGRKKKVGDNTICTNKALWEDCVRYVSVYPKPEEPPSIETYPNRNIINTSEIKLEPKSKPIIDPTRPPPPPPSLCPYLGPPPKGVQTCCGMYCHADNTPLRTGSQCKSYPTYLECVKKQVADRRGKR